MKNQIADLLYNFVSKPGTGTGDTLSVRETASLLYNRMMDNTE